MAFLRYPIPLCLFFCLLSFIARRSNRIGVGYLTPYGVRYGGYLGPHFPKYLAVVAKWNHHNVAKRQIVIFVSI